MPHLPAPTQAPYRTLLVDIEKGLIKIPRFQREFVWTKEQSAMLIDSLLKGYPIGTFITWKTKEQLRAVRNLGKVNLPDVPEGDFAIYVLDGQQRMTSLFCALKGVVIQRNNNTEDFSQIFINLEANESDQIVTSSRDGLAEGTYIKLVDLVSGDFSILFKYDQKFHPKLQQYLSTIQSYSFSIIEVREAPIDIATEIFTRINVGGKPLTLFEIMAAKTYQAKTSDTHEFDLADKFEELVEELSSVEYGDIPSSTVLQIVALAMVENCSRSDILKLKKEEFIKIWPEISCAIKTAVDFLRFSVKVPVSALLPYHALIAPISYFFYCNQGKPATQLQFKYLIDFFWRAGLSERYSNAVESKLAQDIKRIKQIINNQQPDYDFGSNIDKKYIIENGSFSTSRSIVKAILCIFASLKPVSFQNGATIAIHNDWLIRANSKNYHHFFPKAYLERKKVDWFYINHIANITIIDDFLNKNTIRAKSPADYLKDFSNNNPSFEDYMSTHLITVTDQLWNNDYDDFFDKRCEAIEKEISKRIIKNDRATKHS